MRNVLVIGAGAAGLMAAGTAADRGFSVTLLERNERPARKLMITGKGRCNVTNNCTLVNELIENVPTNGRFLFSAFTRFMPSDTMDFFENAGVPLKIERGNRVFPESDKAVDIVDALVSFAKKKGVRFLHGRAHALRCEEGRVSAIVTQDGEELVFDQYIIATGGMSYPLTGSTGDGYTLARQAGHSIVSPAPSLVPLELEEGNWRNLQGLSLRNAAIKILDREFGTPVYEDFGELLFTHFGVSGPVILSATSHLRTVSPEKYRLSIDLKPALDMEKLDARLLREIKENHTKSVVALMGTLVPKSLIPVILENAGVPRTVMLSNLTRGMRSDIAYALKNLEYDIRGFRPIEEAIVTSGGVDVREIEPKTMRSRLCKNLYFAGEVMDVDAYTGGFNLQIAFATGAAAGNSVE